MKRSLSFIAVVLVIAACSKTEQERSWSRIDLPADGRATVRDVADCGDRWWAVGGVQTGAPGGTQTAAEPGTRPAAWIGGPSRAWTEVRFVPLPASYYGPRQLIRSVACAGGKVAAVGATPGGAHGNPRVSTWLARGDRMTENAAPFETYGGDEAVDVGPIAAGPEGFAIAGTRTSGAAAWFSSDGATFTLSESNRAGTFATDVSARPGGGWLIVGTGADQQPAAWIVDQGRWAPTEAPAATVAATVLTVRDDSLWQATVHR